MQRIAGAIAFLTAIAAWVTPLAADESLRVAVDQPQYAEGARVPRSLTPEERAWLRDHPLAPPARAVTTPSGPVHCVAEYEPMEGLLVAWEGGASLTNIIKAMAVHITTTGNADLHVVVDSASEQTTANSELSSYGGINMSRVKYIIRTTDTVWIRDYGPRMIYEGDCRAIVDHTYNRPRPNDDAFPDYFATVKRLASYDIPLVHGGGNFHLEALGHSFVSRLINNENPSLTEQQIHDLWQDFQNVDTTFFTPFPTSVDATQHIDMWMQAVSDTGMVISDWPFNGGSTQDQICDDATTALEARGYTVHRVPARSVSGVHYTYTNVVMCNDLVLIPLYTNASVTQHNTPARDAWIAACPDKTIVQINSEAIVSLAGVLHCIVMHVPPARNAPNPAAYLRAPNGGGSFNPAQQVEIRWISDDDVAVQNVDLLLSTDGGATWPTTIVSATADDGSYFWTVPDVYTTQARIRVVARDAQGNTGSDDSDADFTINGTPPDCPGDTNGDQQVNNADLQAILDAWASSTGDPNYDAGADLDGSGTVDNADLQELLDHWATSCP